MINFYHSGGAGDFEITTDTLSLDEWIRLKRNAVRLLRARYNNQAADILNDSNFLMYDAINHSNDEFCVLYRTLPIEEYALLERQSIAGDDRLYYRQIAQAISELGRFIRFIAVDIEQEDTPAPVPEPNPRITSDVVERALADSIELLRTRGAISAFDRIHTAFHGYLREICIQVGLQIEDDSNLTFLYRQIRNNHPAFQNLGTRGEDILRILGSLSTTVDSVNTLRNRTSVVHPNTLLLEEPEAMLVINSIRTLFNYINSRL